MELTEYNYKEYIKKHGFKQFCEVYDPQSLTSFDFINIGENEIKLIIESQKFQSLASLNLSGNLIGDKCIELLTKANIFQSLIYLDLSGNNIGDKGAKFIAEIQFRSLESLNLSDNRIKEVSLITKSNWIRLLKELFLDNNNLKGECIKSITELLAKTHKFQSLTNLSLSYNHITAECAQLLAESLKVNKYLISLDLHMNNIHDEGVKYIAESLKFNKHLENLNLYYNHANYDLIELFAKLLKSNKSLINLNLFHNYYNYKNHILVDELLKNNKINKERIVKERAEEKIYFAIIIHGISWGLEFLEIFDTFAGYEYL